MSILSIKTLKERKIVENSIESNFQPASYDLRIGTIFKDEQIFNSNSPLAKKGKIGLKINPSEIVTVLTLENVKMPHDCCGTVFAPNSLSSKGLLILNPGHIDPGFEGPLTVCAINLSTEKKFLSIEDTIFTLVVSELDMKLSENQVYKNKNENLTRDDLEVLMFKTKFKDMSSSIFDLVVGYSGANKLLRNVLFKKFINYWSKFVSAMILGAAIATVILFILYFYNSPSTK